MNQDPAARRPLLADPVLLVLLALSLVANVYFGSHYVRPAPSDNRQVKGVVEGSRLTQLTAVDAAGRTAIIALAGTSRPTVLFVYAPTCTWCERSWPVFLRVARERQKDYAFVSVSVSDKAGLTAPVVAGYVALSPAAIREHDFGTVPQTILVKPDGYVAKTWKGALVGPAQVQFQQAFGLPPESKPFGSD